MASKVLLFLPVPVDSEKLPTSGICCSDFESCGCFQYNSRYCLIPLLRNYWSKNVMLHITIDNDAWEDYCARTRKYDTCLKKFNVTTRWNKECPASQGNKVGIPFQSFVLCKGYFSGVLRSCLWDRHTWNSSRLPYHQVISMLLFE